MGNIVLILALASGCGTKYKVGSATIADLPLSEQEELRSWQADRDRAQGEEKKTRADVNTAVASAVWREKNERKGIRGSERGINFVTRQTEA